MKNINTSLLYLIAGKFIQILLMLCSVRLLTTFLDEEQIGQNYLFVTLISLLNFICLGAINQFYTRNINAWNKKNFLHNALIFLAVYRFLAAIISVIIAIGIYVIFEYEEYLSVNAFIVLIFFSSLAVTTHFLLSSINILGDQVFFTKANVVSTALGLSFSVLFLIYLDNTSFYWLFGVVVSQLLFVYPLYRYLVGKQKVDLKLILAKLNYSNVKRFVVFGLPVTATLFLQWGQNSSYRLIVESKYSIEALGYMGVGYAVSFAVFSAVDNVACQFFNPQYYEKISATKSHEKEKRAVCWNNHARKLISVYVATLFFVVSLSPIMLKILVDVKFHDVYYFVMLGAGVEFMRVLTNLVYLVSQSELKTNTTVVPYIVGFSSMLFLMLLLDKTDSSMLIPVIQALSYIIIFLLLFNNMSKILSIKIDLFYISKVIIFSLPLLICLLIPSDAMFLIYFSSFCFAGLYYCGIVYLLVYKQYLREIK